MPRISNSTLFMVLVLSCGGFAIYRSGLIPLELGGAATGSVVQEVTSPSTLDSSDSSPEFAADDSMQLEVGGISSETLLVQADLPQEPASRASKSIQLVALEEPDDKAAPPSEFPAEPPVRVAKRTKEQEPTFDFTEIDRQIKAGQVVEAHKTLSKLFWQQPELRSSVQERIGLTAKAIYFSPQPHIQEPYVVQAGDQLRKIASKHHVPWQYLSRLNRVDPKRLREGQKLKVIDGPFGAVVTLSDFELTLHHGGQYVRSYPCCIGKNNATPVGKFKVLNKVTNPQYTDPDGKVFASGDSKNPLGSHWLDLGESYGIHGTIEPDSIGKAESRGCIRLLNADVAEVYDLLDLATEVIIRR